MTAELSALIFALSWTMTVPNDVPLSIHSDSLVSLNFAEATFADADNGALPAIARSLTTATRMKRPVRLVHVSSHEGEPWNELVDRVAGHYSAGRMAPTASPTALHRFPCAATFEWLWVAAASPQTLVQYPLFDEGSFKWRTQAANAEDKLEALQQIAPQHTSFPLEFGEHRPIGGRLAQGHTRWRGNSCLLTF